MSFSQAKSIAKSYEKRFELFKQQHELLSSFFVGTPLAEDMCELQEAVEQAWQLNEEGGWIPIEDEGDHFVSMIKHDYKGKLIKSLADVPQGLKQEYADMDEGGFQTYIKELREECREAYAEISDLRDGLENVLTEGSFFDSLIGVANELDVSAKEARVIEVLFSNLASKWEDYRKLSISLVQMANEPVVDGDFDPSLMQALLFNE